MLGAQAVGEETVDKRIDVLAMAIQLGATVFDLEQSELCYSPQYGSAKDAINFAGFQAANVLRGETTPLTPAELQVELMSASPPIVVDVRSPVEFDTGHVPGAINIPLQDLRTRTTEVLADRPVVTYCAVGQRGYLAERILRQRGVSGVRNLTGGFVSWRQFFPTPRQPLTVIPRELLPSKRPMDQPTDMEISVMPPMGADIGMPTPTGREIETSPPPDEV